MRMKVPMSALAKYFLYVVDYNLQEAFKNQITNIHRLNSPYYTDTIKSDRDKSLEFYSRDKKVPLDKSYSFENVTAGITKVITNIDALGNKIEKGHILYELSDAISKFKAGERTNLTVKNDKNLTEYFKEQGQHFCAGYLSQFGEVVIAERINDPLIADYIYWGIKKILNNKSYRVASKTYRAFTCKNVANKLNIDNLESKV